MNGHRSISGFSIAFILSMVLHGTLIALFVSHGDILPATRWQRLTHPNQISLEFVPALENVQEKEPSEPTLIISEKNTRAQNPLSKPHLAKGAPYQRGKAEHPSLERAPVVPGNIIAPVKPLQHKAQEPKKGTEIKRPRKRDPSGILKTEKPGQKSTPRPRPSSFRSSGREEFESPARRNIHTVADILAEYSYNSRSGAVARYFSREYKKIASVWQLEIYSSQEFSSLIKPNIKRTVLAFKIMPDGNIEDLRVIIHEGSELLARYAIQAVEKNAPFAPLPKEVLSYIRTDGLWIRMEFNYS